MANSVCCLQMPACLLANSRHTLLVHSIRMHHAGYITIAAGANVRLLLNVANDGCWNCWFLHILPNPLVLLLLADLLLYRPPSFPQSCPRKFMSFTLSQVTVIYVLYRQL